MTKEYSSLHIHPDYKNRIKTEYIIEYTANDELKKEDESNVKKMKCNGLEEMTKKMFQLRQNGRHNISIYYCNELDGQWITEDSCYYCDDFLSDAKQRELANDNIKLENKIESQEEEIKFYKEFISKYNANKLLDQFIKEYNNKAV